MSRQVQVVNTATDTFQIFVDKTNEVIEIVNTYVITANNGSPDITSGNAFVNGFFGANNLLVQTLSGGDFTASANLTISTNVAVNSASFISVGNSVVNSTSVNTSLLNIGNSTVNSVANSTTLKISNSTSNITLSTPTAAQVSNGFFFLNANSTWSVVPTPQTLQTNTIVLEHSQHTTNTFTTTGTSQQTVDQFAVSTFRSAEYLVSVKDNNANGYQTSKMIMIHDDTTALVTEYSVLVTNTSLGVFAADINGANVRLLFTPISSNTTVKYIRELIEV